METASWVFGSLFVVFLMAVVVYRLGPGHSKPLDSTTQNILGLFCATLAGLFAFFLTGTIATQINGSGGQWGGIGAQATGGIALFLVVLWWWKSSGAPLQSGDKTIRALGTSFKIVDRVYPEVKAVVQGTNVTSVEPYSVQASQQGDRIVFTNRSGDNALVISGEDLKKLPPSDRDYIQAVEGSMEALFKQWTQLFPKRNSGDASQSAQIEADLQNLAMKMCEDLQRVFDHLGSIGAVLNDHYSAMRSICYEAQRSMQSKGTQTIFNTNIQGNVGKQTNINKIDGDVSF